MKTLFSSSGALDLRAKRGITIIVEDRGANIRRGRGQRIATDYITVKFTCGRVLFVWVDSTPMSPPTNTSDVLFDISLTYSVQPVPGVDVPCRESTFPLFHCLYRAGSRFNLTYFPSSFFFPVLFFFSLPHTCSSFCFCVCICICICI